MAKYTIKKGDTLSEIASNYGTTVADLAKTNGISNPNLIQAGATLIVPDLDKLGINNTETKKEDTGFKYTPFEYEDFEKSKETLEAEGKKSQAEADYDNLVKEGVQSEYKELADQLLKDYMNREDFSYDFNGDALYQQYKDKYIKQGKMAMQDTIGQASAMTGGYGNSYAATAGNQAYQASIENLNDVIPELYQMAYDRYNQKGQDMLNQYSLASDAYSRDYGEYMDKLGILDSDRSYWGIEADNSFNKDWGMYDSNRTFEQGRHDTEQGYLYQTGRDAIEDARKERELKMAEEEWGYKKKAYEDGLDSGDNDNKPKSSPTVNDKLGILEDDPAPKATETKNTNNFIANHQTKDEFMARGDKSYKQYIEYIEGEINKAESSLTDEEIAYLVKYYGLS